MEEKQLREKFDTGLKKIGLEIKSRLVHHGIYGSVLGIDTGSSGDVPEGLRLEITAKGRTVQRSFDRKQIEGCCLRVGGEVLAAVIAMVDEISTTPRPESAASVS
jgi:hypothetical protein